MWSDLLLLAPAAVVFVVLFFLWPRKNTAETAPAEEGPPVNAIVVDGSNVMYWGGEPSLKILSRVLQNVKDAGYAPIVFFDANVGYIVEDRYLNEAQLAPLIDIWSDRICVVSKGVVADESILMFATVHGLRIVTNDQYRDWRVQFPHAAKRGILVKGKWVSGNVKWARPLRA